MSLTIARAVAAHHAVNVANVIRTGVFNDMYIGEFFHWLDNMVKSGNNHENRVQRATHIVNTAPYDFNDKILARHPRLLADYEGHKKDRSSPPTVQEVFGKIFSQMETSVFSDVERTQFLDSLINLVGYDVLSEVLTLGAMDREDVAKLVNNNTGRNFWNAAGAMLPN